MVNGTLASTLAGIASKALWRESHSRLLDIFIHKCILLRGLIGLTKGKKIQEFNVYVARTPFGALKRPAHRHTITSQDG